MHRLSAFVAPAWAVITGVMWAFSFPRFGFAGLAWLVPGSLLLAGLKQGPGQAFRLAYLAGLVHYLISLHWLLFIPYPPGAMAAWLSLSAYLAFYPATWVWLCWRLFPVGLIQTGSGLSSGFGRFFSVGWARRTWWALQCGVVWVALEMVLARLLSGFPWNLLGVSQYQMLPLLQVASFTGVYGISFLVVWSSVALMMALMLTVHAPSHRWGWRKELGLPLTVLAGVALYGMRLLMLPSGSAREISVALVQPSIPQELIWDLSESTNRFNKLIRLSEAALAAKPDLLIWPEASLPSFSESNYVVLTNLIARHRVWMIFGADEEEPQGPGVRPLVFNSSFLFDPQGHFVAAYRKRQLVIFGEYVPLRRWLPFLRHFTPITGSFTPGERPVPFVLRQPGVKISTLICFEDIFPHLVREYVEPDIDFLVNLTNNGWFGESAAQWQHAANAVFRAVENGIPLVRCANNGLTCWVDCLGRMHEAFFGDSQDIYGAGFKTARIPLRAEGQWRAPTFYSKKGDVFGWSCVVVAVISVLVVGVREQTGRGALSRVLG
jgi:apolipoprotein N-acyltransferase